MHKAFFNNLNIASSRGENHQSKTTSLFKIFLTTLAIGLFSSSALAEKPSSEMVKALQALLHTPTVMNELAENYVTALDKYSITDAQIDGRTVTKFSYSFSRIPCECDWGAATAEIIKDNNVYTGTVEIKKEGDGDDGDSDTDEFMNFSAGSIVKEATFNETYLLAALLEVPNVYKKLYESNLTNLISFDVVSHGQDDYSFIDYPGKVSLKFQSDDGKQLFGNVKIDITTLPDVADAKPTYKGELKITNK